MLSSCGSADLILIMTALMKEEFENKAAELSGENHLVRSY